MYGLPTTHAQVLTSAERRPGEPPLVRTWLPWLGAAWSFGLGAPDFLARCQRRYGDVFTVLIAGRRMTFVLDAHSHMGVLKQDALTFYDLAHELSARAFGHPRLHGPLAHALEQATEAHLRGAPLSHLTARTQELLDARLEAADGADWETHKLNAFIRRALLPAIADAMFGDGFMTPAALDDLDHLNRRLPLLLAGLPAGLIPGVVGARRRLAHRLQAARPDEAALRTARRSLLGALPLQQQGYVELSLLWATLTNTLPAVFWTLAHLLHDGLALAAVTTEVRGAVARPEPGPTPLLQSAISEALRLSSASLTLRRASRDMALRLDAGEVAVREGDLVCLFPYLMHHDPEIYPAPERFRLQRFSGERGTPTFEKGGRKVHLALMPYGGGASLCPGRFLANTEIKQLVAGVLLRFDLMADGEPLPRADHRRAGIGVLPPRGDMRFRLRRAS